MDFLEFVLYEHNTNVAAHSLRRSAGNPIGLVLK
jgi:hypothetical protein